MKQYNITLDVLQFTGITADNKTGAKHANWNKVSTFYLNPSYTIGRSSDGKASTLFCIYTLQSMSISYRLLQKYKAAWLDLKASRIYHQRNC